MKIWYKDMVTGKKHYTRAEYGYRIEEAIWLGEKVLVLEAHRKNDVLVIPEWSLLGESRKLLKAVTK